MPARKSEGDKRQAKYLKDNGIERTSGRCARCYRMIPNDTFGGSGAQNHANVCPNALTGKSAKARNF